MAEERKQKKKKNGKGAGGGQDFIMREILGILVLTLAVLSAIGLGAARDEATTLFALKKIYFAVFGYTAVAVPVLLGLAGVFIIWRKPLLLKYILHIFLLVLLAGAMLNVVAPGAPGSFSGGRLTGWLTVWMVGAMSAPGAFLVIFATVLIYAKLALRISYIEAGKKAAPYMNKAGALAVAGCARVGSFAAARMKLMQENRRKKLEAEKARIEKENEEKARRLQEEEAKRLKEEQSFMADAPPVIEEKKRDRKKRDVKRQAAGMEMDVKSASAKGADADLETVAGAEDEEPAEEEEIEEYNEKERVTVTGRGKEGEEVIMWSLPDPGMWLDVNAQANEGAMDNTMRDKLEATLKNFQVPARISNVVKGASFTRFEIELEPGTKVSRIVSLEADIALSLATDIKTIRIEAPIPGKSAIGIEVPNKERAMVPLAKVFNSSGFRNMKVPLSFILGEDIDGQPVVTSITKMPHLLVAGSTGSGKSVCLNGIITNIISKEYPSEVRFIMVDMKRVELTPYEGIPHLLTPVIMEAPQAANALRWVCNEMDSRYKHFAEVGVRNIDGYNAYVEDPADKMHRIVFIIDELADLMMVSSPAMNVENYICRVAQLARATGIHLILATQRPDAKVITGTIKNNIPTRIAFAVASQIDSRTIIDQKGAESLLGRGDMLFQSFGNNKLRRLQGAFVSDDEVRKLVQFWREQGMVAYPLRFEGAGPIGANGTSEFTTEDESLYHQALEIVVSTQQASISMIQRRLRIGYNRAARLVDLMEERGVVSASDGSSRPREVLITSIE